MGHTSVKLILILSNGLGKSFIDIFILALLKFCSTKRNRL